MILYAIVIGGFVAWVASAWVIHHFYYLPKVRPKKLTITEYPSGILIVYRWIESENYWYAPFVLSFPFLLILDLFFDLGNVESERQIIYFFHALALVFTYTQILGWVNKTRLFLDNAGKTTVLHGPLPGIRDPNRIIDSVIDIVYTRRRLLTPLFSFKQRFIYAVFAIGSDGKRVRILQDIYFEDTAQVIVRSLRQHLHQNLSDFTIETLDATRNS